MRSEALGFGTWGVWLERFGFKGLAASGFRFALGAVYEFGPQIDMSAARAVYIRM